MKRAVTVAVLLVLCLAVRASAQADSIHLVGTWSAVTQANGQPALYRPRLVKLGAPRDSVWIALNTPATTAQFTVPRPAAGDSSRWRLQVRAYDVRGDSSLLVQSPVLVLRRPWLPPAPPALVQLDSAAVTAAAPDSLKLYAVRGDTAVFSRPGDPITLRVGETLPFLPGQLVGRRPGGARRPALELLR